MTTTLNLPNLSRNGRYDWLLWPLAIVLPGGSLIPVIALLLAKRRGTQRAEIRHGH